ncbi:MAG: hypothetical protein AAFZ65_15180 [Planctomycetota bacterium]
MLIAALLAAPAAQIDPPAFTIAALDPAATTTLPVPFDAASPSQVVGSATPVGGSFAQPALFTALGPQLLPVPPGSESGELLGVQQDGIAVGVSFEVETFGEFLIIRDRAVRWSGGVPELLDDLTTGGAALELQRAVDLDSIGRILGVGRDASIPAGRSFLWDNGLVTDLGILPGALPTAAVRAEALNESGVVVGTGDGATLLDHAFRWENGVMVDLHVASGVVGRVSSAFDVAPDGTAVGGADFTDDFIDFQEPALWTPSGELVRIGTFGGSTGLARGTNAHGDVVGTARNTTNQSRAFLYRNGVLVDLNDFLPPASGWFLLEGTAITDDGTIVGIGNLDGDLQGFRLDPTPCAGAFEVFGEPCGGDVAIAGFGCPSPGSSFVARVQQAPPSTPGVMLFGLGTVPLPIAPNCVLNVQPLIQVQVPIGSDADGQLDFEVTLGPMAPSVDITLQPVFVDSTFSLSAPPALVVSIP